MTNITLPVPGAWLSFINVPYPPKGMAASGTGLVQIEIPNQEAQCLIELGRMLERILSRQKNAA